MPVDRVASEECYHQAIKCIEASQAARTPEDRASKSDEGLHKLEQALDLNPLNHKARFVLAGCAMRVDDFQRVKREGTIIYNALTEDERHKMGDAVLHLMLAHACKMIGELENAIRYATEASELYPSDPHPHMILGELFEVKGNNAEAERQCREALMFQSDPGCRHSLNEQSVYLTLCCLGGVLARQAKYTEAERFLSQAMALSYSEESPLAARHLVDIYMFQGRYREALHLCQKLKAKFPDDDEVREKLDNMLQGLATSSSDVESHSTIRESHKVHSGRNSHRGSESDGSRRQGDRDNARRKGSRRRSHPDSGNEGPPKMDPVPEALETSDHGGMATTEKSGGGFCCCFDRRTDTGRYEV